MNSGIQILRQFITYAGVGAIGTVAHYVVLAVMVELFGLTPVFASSCGAITGAFVNYLLNYKFTFRSKKKHSEALTKFMFVATAGFFINLVLMWLLTSVLAINYLIAQLVSTAIVLVTNYAINRAWTF